jgi:hypothetical protein
MQAIFNFKHFVHRVPVPNFQKAVESRVLAERVQGWISAA